MFQRFNQKIFQVMQRGQMKSLRFLTAAGTNRRSQSYAAKIYSCYLSSHEFNSNTILDSSYVHQHSERSKKTMQTLTFRTYSCSQIHTIGQQSMSNQTRFFSKLSDMKNETKEEHVKDEIEKDQRNKNPILDSKFLDLTPATRNQIQAIWTQSQSIPNIITISRILSIPVLCNFIIHEQYYYAMTGCLIAGGSDWLDGYIARNYNQKTTLGTYLDPLADKFFINSIGMSLGYVGFLPFWCTCIWMGRDVLLIGMAYKLASDAAEGRGHNVADPSQTPLEIKASTVSKVNTVLQFGSIFTALGCAYISTNTGYANSEGLLVDMLQWINEPLVDIILSSDPSSSKECVDESRIQFSRAEGLCYVTCGTTIWSGLGYMNGKAMEKKD